jgi:hypothetical protein
MVFVGGFPAVDTAEPALDLWALSMAISMMGWNKTYSDRTQWNTAVGGAPRGHSIECR